MMDPDVDTTQHLTFQVAGAEYALPLRSIREIVECPAITHVPSTPPSIRGLFNLRGAVLPAIDLSARFGFGATTIQPRTCLILVDVELDDDRVRVGILADAVTEVVELANAEVSVPPMFGTRIRADYLAGVATRGNELLLLLDAQRILALDELTAAVEAELPAANEAADAHAQ